MTCILPHWGMVILGSLEALVEVFLALSSLHGEKALGLDNFTRLSVALLGLCEIQGFGFLRGVLWARPQATFERSLNASFMVLIPKKGKNDLKDFDSSA